MEEAFVEMGRTRGQSCEVARSDTLRTAMKRWLSGGSLKYRLAMHEILTFIGPSS